MRAPHRQRLNDFSLTAHRQINEPSTNKRRAVDESAMSRQRLRIMPLSLHRHGKPAKQSRGKQRHGNLPATSRFQIREPYGKAFVKSLIVNQYE